MVDKEEERRVMEKAMQACMDGLISLGFKAVLIVEGQHGGNAVTNCEHLDHVGHMFNTAYGFFEKGFANAVEKETLQ